MAYVIPAVLVVLAIAGFVTFIVLNATNKSGPAAKDDAPGIGADETPLGDTTQHAGEQTRDGATVGTHGASGSDSDQADRDAAAHVARPGEGEGAERLGFEGQEPPASERLADRGF
jgi:hypothetical protein